jgi:hypothetical protein
MLKIVIALILFPSSLVLLWLGVTGMIRAWNVRGRR